MHTIANRPDAPSQVLLQITAVLQQLAIVVRDAGQRFNAKREARRRAATTIRELSALSDRDLRDMGISRGDIARLAREERSWPQV